MRNVLMLCAIALLIVAPVRGARAQDDGSNRFTPEQQALIKTLTDAFNNVNQLPAVQYNQVQTLTQEISVPSEPLAGTISTTLVQDIVSVIVFEEGDTRGIPALAEQNLEQTMVMSGAGIDQTVVQSLDFILIDGIYYARIEQTAPIMDLGFPEGWFNLSDDPYAIPGMEIYNVEQLFSLQAVVPTQDIANIAFEDVVLLDEYEVDGETFQDILVTWDIEQLYTNKLFGIDQSFNLEAWGVSTEDFLAVFIEGSTFTYTATINTTTGFPDSITTVMVSELDLPASIFGVQMVMDQSVINEITLSGLAEIPDITVPTIGE